MSREARITLALMVSLAAAETFRSYLPPLWKLRDAGDTRRDLDLRGSEAHAIGYALVIGGVVGAIIRSPWPLYGALAAVAFSFAQYEWAMQPSGPGELYGSES